MSKGVSFIIISGGVCGDGATRTLAGERVKACFGTLDNFISCGGHLLLLNDETWTKQVNI